MILPHLKRPLNFFRFLLLAGVSVVLSACTTLDLGNGSPIYNPPVPYYSNIKVAVVLGGGGAKGLAHVAILEELEANGIKPDLIVGCSAGAIVGALYADTLNIAKTKELLIKLKRDDLLDISLTHLPYGLSNGAILKQFLSKNLKAKSFNDLKLPFVAVATNLKTGELAAFNTSDDLQTAIRASAAFPSVFLPVKIHNNHFIDGGVVNAVPVEVAKKLGAEFVIAVQLGGHLPEEAPTNIFGILKRSLEISYVHQGRMATQPADYTINIPLQMIGTFEDGKNDDVYQAGINAARLHMDKLKQKLLSQKLKKN